MSSQGPATGTATGFTRDPDTCVLTGNASQVPPGYAFSRVSIRDASDWIKFKKQALIYNDPNSSKAKDPWFVHGNDFRLNWMNGGSKCVPCQGMPFNGRIF